MGLMEQIIGLGVLTIMAITTLHTMLYFRMKRDRIVED